MAQVENKDVTKPKSGVNDRDAVESKVENKDTAKSGVKTAGEARRLYDR